jgi:hypothetical protein
MSTDLSPDPLQPSQPKGQRALTIALALFGSGLLAAAVVGVVYINKLEHVERLQQAQGLEDWWPLKRLEGKSIATGGAVFTIKQVLYGPEVIPAIRNNALAGCRDAVVFRLEARNQEVGTVTLTPALMTLMDPAGRKAEQIYTQGFEPPQWRKGEVRSLDVGFQALTTSVPCRFAVEGDVVSGGAAAEAHRFDGAVDLCGRVGS